MEVGGTSSGSRVCVEGEEQAATARSNSDVSLTEEEGMEGDDDLVGVEEDASAPRFVPGPLIPLKEQLERDKDDESLRRWKEKLLGCVEGELDDQVEPEVIFHSIAIVAEGCPEIITPLPLKENQTRVLFTLKEGSQYCLKLTFSVKHNIVSGLAYLNTVWKAGLQVDQIQGMVGTFAPHHEPYTHMLDEETTPSGAIARGMYLAKLKFEDDDKRCHMELDYSFEIKRR